MHVRYRMQQWLERFPHIYSSYMSVYTYSFFRSFLKISACKLCFLHEGAEAFLAKNIIIYLKILGNFYTLAVHVLRNLPNFKCYLLIFVVKTFIVTKIMHSIFSGHFFLFQITFIHTTKFFLITQLFTSL